MEIEIRKISVCEEVGYNIRTLCDFSSPKFIYGDLIALKSNGKYGCINKKTGKLVIEFSFDDIEVGKNGIIKAIIYWSSGNGKTVLFYDINGQYIDKCGIPKEKESYFLKENDLDISFVISEEFDEISFTTDYTSEHILANGTSVVTSGLDIDHIPKSSIKRLSDAMPIYPKEIENFDDFEIEVKEKVNKYNINTISPFLDPNWVVIEDCIYFSNEGQLKVFDLVKNDFVGLIENYIFFPMESIVVSDKNIAFYKNKYSNYKLLFEKDHLVAVNENSFALEFKFGSAIKNKYFTSEEEMEEYIIIFEEEFLNKILS